MRTETSLRCIISVLLFAGAASTALGQELVKLPTPGLEFRTDAETAIAVNPLDPCEAVAVWFAAYDDPLDPNDVKEGFYASTMDGWDTYHIGQFAPLNLGHADPSIAYDPFNEVFWASYVVKDPGFDVRYAKSAIVGGVIEFPTATLLADGGDKPWLAVGQRPGLVPESNLYLAYYNASSIIFRRSVSGDCDPPDGQGRC